MKLLANKKQYAYDYVFDCPGCGFKHGFYTTGDVVWQFNGDLNNPTVTPSILSTFPLRSGTKICHSFITNGMIQFLSDCTHKLAGQTLELPEIDMTYEKVDDENFV